jgi:hypothetical protein
VSYPQSTSRGPVLEWLERNAVNPSKVVGFELEASEPRAEIRLSVDPDETLRGWVASLGFDLNLVVHVSVTPTELKVTKLIRDADGALLIEGVGMDVRYIREVVTIDLTA